MDPELKPCPFCGGTAALRGDGYLAWVVCDNCDAEGPSAVVLGQGEKRAAEKWNTRASTTGESPASAPHTAEPG